MNKVESVEYFNSVIHKNGKDNILITGTDIKGWPDLEFSGSVDDTPNETRNKAINLATENGAFYIEYNLDALVELKHQKKAKISS